jgi:chromate transport protein ChrA
VGANQIIHGGQLYDGSIGLQVGGGDTYGPANYLAYVPFRLVLHSGDEFDNAAIRGAAIFFDLLTLAGLIVLGRRLRAGPEGTKMGLALGYAWAAFPYSALALSENTNDTLIAALLVWTLVVLLSPWRRGIVLAVASLVKFVPLALVPLIATGKGPRSARAWLTFGLAFAATALVLIVPFVPPSALHRFYSLTLGAQLHRKTPLSLWGQAPSLEPLKYLLTAATVGLGIFLAFRPTVRSRAQVAAFSAALLIAIQICVSYWYYTYVVWFAPLVLVALFSQYRLGAETPEHRAETADAVEPPVLAVAEPVAG